MSNHSELKTINFIPVCVFLHTFYDKNQHMYTYLWLNENVLSKKSNTVKHQIYGSDSEILFTSVEHNG